MSRRSHQSKQRIRCLPRRCRRLVSLIVRTLRTSISRTKSVRACTTNATDASKTVRSQAGQVGGVRKVAAECCPYPCLPELLRGMARMAYHRLQPRQQLQMALRPPGLLAWQPRLPLGHSAKMCTRMATDETCPHQCSATWRQTTSPGVPRRVILGTCRDIRHSVPDSRACPRCRLDTFS